MVSKIKYPIRRVINWYYGNFCTRKCFSKEKRIQECRVKFDFIVETNPDLMMTHKEFKDLIDTDNIKICRLNPLFKRRTVGWKQFESWLNQPGFDPDKF